MSYPNLRRLLHASSALVILTVPFGSEAVLRFVLLGGAVLAISLDSLRVAMPAFGKRVVSLVPVFREPEANSLSGATWLSIGFALAAWFPYPASVAGILVGALADPAASLIGSRYGKAAEKTWSGSFAAAIVAAAAIGAVAVFNSTSIPWIAVLLGAAAATVLERWSGKLNDNLLVAPGTALVVWLIIST